MKHFHKILFVHEPANDSGAPERALQLASNNGLQGSEYISMAPRIRVAGLKCPLTPFLMRVLTLAFALALPLLVACAPPAGDAQSFTGRSAETDIAGQLAQYLDSRVARGFSGAVLVETADGIILNRTFGMPDLPADREPCFWIASVSKMFTAATAVSLQERGMLDLGAPIVNYIDPVPDDKRAITMHHLLTHTSGLADSYVAEGIADQQTAIVAILATPLAHPTGETYLYSANGYSLAALIIEKAGGRRFEESVRELVLAPAGMLDTGFWGYPVETCALVPFETRQSISDANRAPNYGFRGPTGLRSTTADLRKWYKALAADRLLSPASRELIFTPHVAKAPKVSYGYGWNIVKTDRDTRMLAHTGQDDLISHISYVYAFPDEDVLVVLLADASVNVSNKTLRGIIGILFPEG